MRLVVLAVLGVMVTAGFSGCGSSPDRGEAAGTAAMVDSGSWYVHERWPHDGDPIESDSFVVYSDAASVPDRLLLVRTLMDISAGRSIYQTFPSWGPLALHVSVAEWYSFGVPDESQQMRTMSNGDMLAWHCSEGEVADEDAR